MVGIFNYPDTFWKSNSARYKISNAFLAYVGHNFLFEKVKLCSARSLRLLNLVLANGEELTEAIKGVGWEPWCK